MAGPPKITQRELARACGVHPVSVNDWVKGRTFSIEGSHLLAAAAFLNVRPRWLADGVGPMRPDRADESQEIWIPAKRIPPSVAREVQAAYAGSKIPLSPAAITQVVQGFVVAFTQADEIARRQSLLLIEAMAGQPERSDDLAKRLSATLLSGSPDKPAKPRATPVEGSAGRKNS
ncbi:MAG: XRE family transcriptional regulator [Comamonadaceae bacterium]|nr:MAG: XRE family transcriptional regulator [Comamonadaceae bacterium]